VVLDITAYIHARRDQLPIARGPDFWVYPWSEYSQGAVVEFAHRVGFDIDGAWERIRAG
jgi:hypothetical protein